jgi:hypothetical protein
VGISAASIPSFRAFARRYLPRILGEHNSGTHHHGSISITSISVRPRQSIKQNTVHNTTTANLKSSIALDRSDVLLGNFQLAEGGMKTTIEQITMMSESQERLHLPEGKIVVGTQITTSVEGLAKNGSWYSR